MGTMEIVNSISVIEKQKITALEDRVIVEYASPTKEFRVEYRYSELKSRVVRGKSGDSVWSNIGSFFLSAAFVVAIGSIFLFREFFDSPYYRLAVLGLAVVGVVAYGLRLVKYDKVWFDEKDENSGFLIKLTKNNREEAEKMISYLTEKIHQAESASKSD